MQFFDQGLVFALEPGAGDVAAGPATDFGHAIANAGQFVGQFLLGLGRSIRIGDLNFAALHVEHGDLAFELLHLGFGAHALRFILAADGHRRLGVQFLLLCRKFLVDGLLLDLGFLGVVVAHGHQPIIE